MSELDRNFSIHDLFRAERDAFEERRRIAQECYRTKVQELRDSFAASSAEFNAVTTTLTSDWQEAQAELKSNDSPSKRRAAFRVAFATLEGILYQLQRLILDEVRESPDQALFSRYERDALEGYSGWRMNDGKSKEGSNQYIRFRDNVRFTFNMIQKLTGVVRAQYGTTGCQSLEASEKVRNGLMHPKQSSDLNIEGAQLAVLIEGVKWFAETFMTVMKDWSEVHQRRIEKLDAEDTDDARKIAEVKDQLSRLEEAAVAKESEFMRSQESLQRSLAAEIARIYAAGFEAGRRAASSPEPTTDSAGSSDQD